MAYLKGLQIWFLGIYTNDNYVCTCAGYTDSDWLWIA